MWRGRAAIFLQLRVLVIVLNEEQLGNGSRGDEIKTRGDETKTQHPGTWIFACESIAPLRGRAKPEFRSELRLALRF